MRKRGLCCHPASVLSVSVRPSICHVGVCIQTAEHTVKLLVRLEYVRKGTLL